VPAIEFRILGPLEVSRNGRLVRLGGERQHALLALLLLRANEVRGSCTARACRIAGRELTAAKWAQFLPSRRRRPVCP
jgi:hypothetical protein